MELLGLDWIVFFIFPNLTLDILQFVMLLLLLFSVPRNAHLEPHF